MNPVDHPHGGGEGKTSGGRNPVTPWGRPTRGYKTRSNKRTQKMILKDRERRSEPEGDMARSVKKGPFIDKGICEGCGEGRAAGSPASAGDQDLVAAFDDYAGHGGAHFRRAQRQTSSADLRAKTWWATSSASFAPTRTFKGHSGTKVEKASKVAVSTAVSRVLGGRDSRRTRHHDGSNSECKIFARFGAEGAAGRGYDSRQDVNQALAILRFTSKRAAGHVEKCMRSAIANANEAAEKANISIDPDDLWVRTAFCRSWTNEEPSPCAACSAVVRLSRAAALLSCHDLFEQRCAAGAEIRKARLPIRGSETGKAAASKAADAVAPQKPLRSEAWRARSRKRRKQLWRSRQRRRLRRRRPRPKIRRDKYWRRLWVKKVHPYGFRLGYNKDWHSHWFAKTVWRVPAGRPEAEARSEATLQRRRRFARRYRACGESAEDHHLHLASGIIIGRKGAEIDKLEDRSGR